MIVERLEVHNLRNVVHAVFEFAPGFNLISGPNGAGKTTVLEAIHAVARAKPLRRGKLNSLIQYDKDQCAIGMRAHAADVTTRVSLQKRRVAGLQLRKEGRKVRQVSELAGILPLQVFLPNVSDLVFGMPAARRQWLDWGMFHVQHGYAEELRRFRRSLGQRNAALRTRNTELIRVWNKRLAVEGETITQRRREYLERVRPEFVECAAGLSPDVAIEVDFSKGYSAETLDQELDIQGPRDIKLGITRTGPHTADLSLRIRRSGRRAQSEAAQELSRGQGKALASAMKLAQAKDLAQTGTQSVFLIDDIAAELDHEYAQRFYRALAESNMQVISTTTEPAGVLEAWENAGVSGFTTHYMARGSVAAA